MNTTSTWQNSEFGLPDQPGVYVVMGFHMVTGRREILYVGSSKNIQRRVLAPSHPYRVLFNRAEYPYLVFTKSKVCTNYLELEKSLIQRLQPKYNSDFKSRPHGR